MPQQILMIHGGTTFQFDDEYLDYLKNAKIDLERITVHDRWIRNLAKDLGEDYRVLAPKMPNSTNASYEEWKIWFKKILGLVDDGLILIGHSLGGVFLAKYLAENKITKKIKATFLLAAPFDDELEGESLAGFYLPEDISSFADQGGEIFLLHSKDDPCVPVDHIFKYQDALPKAKPILFMKGGHFNEERLPVLAELIRKIPGI